MVLLFPENPGERKMLSLTEKAIHQVKAAMAEQSDQYTGVRLSVSGGGCSGFQYDMNLERESRQGDEIVQVEGFQIFVDSQSMLYLEGTEIDYVESIKGAGFQFNNPNVTGTCGCGESFKV